MIVDGRQIAHTIYEEVAAQVATLHRTPILAAITCAPNFETEKYLQLKKRKASEVGITLRVVELQETATTAEVIAQIKTILPEVDGIVVQLPFPAHIDREAVLKAVPVDKDPDGFSYGTVEGACIPPVVGSIKEIADEHKIIFKGSKVVVLGAGRLVGAPAALFLRAAGADVIVLTEVDTDPIPHLLEADIIVSGIGKPHFVTTDMIKPGVAIFDAGTSEDGGVVVGDVHPDVAALSRLYTPVPGGIGPITVALLLRNLLSLIRQYK